MYAITGFVMIHADWFPNNPTDTTRTDGFRWGEVPVGNDWDVLGYLESVQPRIRQDLGIDGRFSSSRKERDGSFALVFRGPGSEEKVFYNTKSDSVRITRRDYGFAQMMNRLHQFKGYRGGVVFILWAFLLDVVSVSLIFFAISGVYLWYTLKSNNRRLGWALLGGSTLYAIGSIAFLMLRS